MCDKEISKKKEGNLGVRMDQAQLNNESESGSIDLSNIKLIRIRNPIPGIWKIRTSSRLKHTLRVLGDGAIDFKYGFAVKLVDKMELVSVIIANFLINFYTIN